MPRNFWRTNWSNWTWKPWQSRIYCFIASSSIRYTRSLIFLNVCNALTYICSVWQKPGIIVANCVKTARRESTIKPSSSLQGLTGLRDVLPFHCVTNGTRNCEPTTRHGLYANFDCYQGQIVTPVASQKIRVYLFIDMCICLYFAIYEGNTRKISMWVCWASFAESGSMAKRIFRTIRDFHERCFCIHRVLYEIFTESV